MLYVIKRTNGAYYHNKGRIILFESKQEAENFINMFIQYSVNRLAAEGDPFEVVGASMKIMQESVISEIDFDMNRIECGTVYAKELMEEKGL